MTKQKDTQTITQSDPGPSHSKLWVILIQYPGRHQALHSTVRRELQWESNWFCLSWRLLKTLNWKGRELSSLKGFMKTLRRWDAECWYCFDKTWLTAYKLLLSLNNELASLILHIMFRPELVELDFKRYFSNWICRRMIFSFFTNSALS